MTNRRFTVLTFAAFLLSALFLPAAEARAQSVWDVLRDRGRDQRDRDYGRGRNGRISDSERRQLRDVSRRIESRSKDFQRDLDRALDRGRYDGTRREDQINQQAKRLRDAAQRFKNVAGNSNDLYRSSGEARRLLDEASQVSNALRRARLDSRASNTWSQLRSDLRWVADFYGYRFNDFGGGYYGRDDDYGRGRGRY